VEAENLSRYIRVNSIEMTRLANTSHIGSCLSVADILAGIYSDESRCELIRDDDPSRDVVIMSKGHAAAALYAALAGADISSKEALTLFCANKTFFGHASHEVKGVEFSTGSLGHGLSLGVGVALSKRVAGVSGRVFCICSDGEMNEGSVWEAIAVAGHMRLSNLTLLIDYNKIQSFGTTAEVLDLEPFNAKLKAFRWDVMGVDGHDLDKLEMGLAYQSDLPVAVICHTIKGKGVARMENKLEWHYKSPTAEDTI
jgi:transketolase